MMLSARYFMMILLVVVGGFACAGSDGGVDAGAEVVDDSADDADADTMADTPVVGIEVDVIEPVGEVQTIELEVHIDFERVEGAVGPRIAEMFLVHSETLTFVDATPGAAATAAGKTVMGQARANHRTRVIAFSAGAQELDSGRIATVRFSGVGDGPFSIRLASDNQIFAPVEANGNLLVGDPVVIE